MPSSKYYRLWCVNFGVKLRVEVCCCCFPLSFVRVKTPHRELLIHTSTDIQLRILRLRFISGAKPANLITSLKSERRIPKFHTATWKIVHIQKEFSRIPVHDENKFLIQIPGQIGWSSNFPPLILHQENILLDTCSSLIKLSLHCREKIVSKFISNDHGPNNDDFWFASWLSWIDLVYFVNTVSSPSCLQN